MGIIFRGEMKGNGKLPNLKAQTKKVPTASSPQKHMLSVKQCKYVRLEEVYVMANATAEVLREIMRFLL